MEATGFLRSLSSQWAPSPEIEIIRKSLLEVGSRIDQELADTVNALQGQPTLATLEAQQLMWQRRHLQLTAWMNQSGESFAGLKVSPRRLAQLVREE